MPKHLKKSFTAKTASPSGSSRKEPLVPTEIQDTSEFDASPVPPTFAPGELSLPSVNSSNFGSLQRTFGNKKVSQLIQRQKASKDAGQIQRLRLIYDKSSLDTSQWHWRKLRHNEQRPHNNTATMSSYDIRRTLQDLIKENNFGLIQELLSDLPLSQLTQIVQAEESDEPKRFVQVNSLLQNEFDTRHSRRNQLNQPSPSNPVTSILPKALVKGARVIIEDYGTSYRAIIIEVKGKSYEVEITDKGSFLGKRLTVAEKDIQLDPQTTSVSSGETSGVIAKDAKIVIEDYGATYHAVVKEVGDDGYKVEITDEGAFKGKELTVPKDAVRPDHRVVGLPGLEFLGPIRPTGGKEVNNRSDMEVEVVGGKYYVRLYLTVPAEAKYDDSPTGKQNQKKGIGESKFKDVQQDPATGQIVISTGDNSMLWVGGGRPLRALKWAEKYIGEHKLKAQNAKDKKALLEAVELAKNNELFKVTKEIKRLSEIKKLSVNQGKRLTLYGGKRERLEQEIKELPTEIKKQEAAFKLHSSIQNPLIRTYLFPLDEFNKITQEATLESLINVEQNGVKINEDKSFNVDRHYEPNQYGFKGKDLETLRTKVLPGSLITYAYDPNNVPKGRSGEVRHAKELRQKMGIPLRDLKQTQWTEDGEFTDKKKFKGNADTLNTHYITWLQSKQTPEERKVHPLMSGNIEIAYTVRKEKLEAFLKENEVKPGEVDTFMQEVVAPWASQNAIAELMSQDYERMNRDVNITDKAYVNNYDKLLHERTELESHQNTTGQTITKMYKAGKSPKEIIDYLIGEFPELKKKYEEVCATTEKYTFYEHAQMVLGQYLKLITAEGKDEKKRIIPPEVIVKAIIFHDIEKENSKAQYTNLEGKKKNKKAQSHDQEGEHKLSVDTMKRFANLWGSKKELNIAVSFVDADPFGFYLRGLIDKEQVFKFIVGLAFKLGVAATDIGQFFHEYHQFYQADFSSYTSDSSYTPMGEDDEVSGKETSLGKYLEKGEDAKSLKLNDEQARFEYSDAGNYKKKFAELEALFAKPELILKTYKELVEKEQELEMHKNKRRFGEEVVVKKN
jgi:hypothetical protein